MASIHLEGDLSDSLGDVDVGAVIKFTHLSTTGETIASTESELLIAPDGLYSIDLEYGRIRIDYTTKNTERYIATVVVNQDSTATTLPELLNAAVPETDDVILEMQAILADANDAASRAETAADTVNVDGTNTSVGLGTLENNTVGGSGTAFGQDSLSSNTTGDSNTASGRDSLRNNTTGESNTASGRNSLRNNTTGSFNTALGREALNDSTTGGSNTALGFLSLSNNTTGSFNIAIGSTSLRFNTTGSGNTAISPVDSAGVYSPVFSPTIENDRFCAGSTSVTNAYVQVPWTVVSDARDKTEFNKMEIGLDFINNLNPISYKFRRSRDSGETVGTTKYGFKAQEVLALEGENPVIVDNEDSEKLRMIDTALIPVLVKAVQELAKTIELQQEQINELKSK